MPSLRPLAAELGAVGPAPPNPVAALRAGVTMAAPLLVLWGTSRLDLAVYATFGALAAVYGGATAYRGRWRVQLGGATALVAAVASGCAVSAAYATEWAAVPVAAAWAAVAASASDRWRWVPPGPMFVVFAVATTASVPAGPETIGPRTVGAAVLTAAGAAVLALALGRVEELCGSRPDRPPPPVDQPVPRRRLHAVRCLVVVAAAGSVAILVGVTHPYWAMAASVVPLARPGLRSQLVRGTHRVVGTFAGLGLAAVLLVLGLPTLFAVLLLGLLQGLTELVVARNYALALVLITPLALLAAQLADAQPVGDLLVSRLLETVIGAGLGMVAAVLTRERPA